MIHIFLDDLRRCPEGFTLARTAEECLMLLAEYEVDILSLDHDLGIDQPNGTELVKQIIVNGLYPRQIYLHTSSPSGKKIMYELFYEHKPDRVILHNGPMPQNVLDQVRQAASRD